MPTATELYHRPTKHRENIISELRKSGAHEEANRLEMCGKTHEVYWNITKGQPQITPHRCQSRWCPICGKIRRGDLQERVKNIIDSCGRENVRFVTLTQRARSRESIEAAGDRFRKSLRKLIHSKWWKTYVSGAYIRYESDYNPEKKWWHYHAHLLTHGRYIPQLELRNHWSKASPGSFKVDVRRIRENEVFELVKYVSKLRGRGYVPLDELTRYCRHHKMYSFIGDFIKLARVATEPIDHDELILFGSVSDFVYRLEINILSHDYALICQELYRRKHEIEDLSKTLIDIIEEYIIREGIENHLKQSKS